MDRELISNVILWYDGSIHIAMKNRKSVMCTNSSFKDFLSDPIHFVNTAEESHRSTTNLINSKYEELEKINGVVLASAYSNREITIFYTELLKKYFEKSNYAINTPLTLCDIANKEKLADQKEFMLKFFLSVSQMPEFMTKLTSSLNLDPQYMTQCFQEILISLMNSSENIKSTLAAHEIISETNQVSECEVTQDDPDKPYWVTIATYAEKRGLHRSTVSNWRSIGKFKRQKRVGPIWYVDLNELPEDGRKGRKVKKDNETGTKIVRLKGDSEKDVQEYLRERAMFSDGINRFIRSVPEALYFFNHYYKEIEDLNGKPALVIDICPDFINPYTGKSNAQVISEGGSPVIPFEQEELSLFDVRDNFSRTDPPVFHLHHIGQRPDSPLAIIPETDHNSKEWYSVFHPHASGSEDIDRKNFEQKERPAFWKRYLHLYDYYGDYLRIPKRNPMQKHKNKAIDKAKKDTGNEKEVI